MTGMLRYILPILLLMAMEPKQILGGLFGYCGWKCQDDVMALVKIKYVLIKDGKLKLRPSSGGYYNPAHGDKISVQKVGHLCKINQDVVNSKILIDIEL